MKGLAILLSALSILIILLIGCSSRPKAHPDSGAMSGANQQTFKQTPPPDRAMFFEFDSYPVVTKSAEPEYPEAAKKRGFRGTVIVMIVIDEAGRVEEAWVSESDDPILDDAAIAAAYRFRFTPAKSKGVPVKATVSIPFRFSWTE
jgi:TonB family protein